MNKNKEISRKFKLFFYKHEYVILDVAGIISGLLIISIANNFFVTSRMYYLIFIAGYLVCSFGFILEYLIKNEKRKYIEKEFGYFLYDLGREYKKTSNLSLALRNISESNFYGSIHTEILRLSNRVSWGQSFEEALIDTNNTIKSKVVANTISLLHTLKKSDVPYHRLLSNLSKDASIFKQEKKSKKYFSNLFSLCVVFYFIFVFALLYIDLVVGKNFLWFDSARSITKIFFDNFLLYIALLISFFTAFVMYNISDKKSIVFLKYVAIFFVLTIILFQVFIPKPDAQTVLIETINYLDFEDLHESVFLNRIIAIKSLSSKEIVQNSSANMVYFIPFKNKFCGEECAEYSILLKDPVFFNFEVQELEDNIFYVYYGTLS